MIEFKTATPDTEKRKTTEQIKSYVQLDERHIIYEQEFFADFTGEDEAMPSTNELFSSSETYKRECVVGVEKFWYYKTGLWGVKVHLRGVSYDIEPCFKGEHEAQSFFDAVVKWMSEA